MFDSQICSLTTITYFVQFFAVATIVGFKLRQGKRFNDLGLICAIMVMAVSCFACLCVDQAAGITQGVTLVAVALLASSGRDSVEHSF